MKLDDELAEKVTWFNRALSYTRYVMILAVFAIFAGAMALMLSATIEMVSAIWHEIAVLLGNGESDGELRVHLIEALDTVLVSTVLYVIAIGLYQLFVDGSLKLPKWLQTEGVDDLEKRLAGMVVTVLSVMFVTQALQWQEGRDLTGLGISIGIIVVAVSLFLYQEKKFHGHEE